MKKILLSFILLTLVIANMYSTDDILIAAYKNSKEEGSLKEAKSDLKYLEGVLTLYKDNNSEYTEFLDKSKLMADKVFLCITSFQNNQYNRFRAVIYPTYVKTIDRNPTITKNSTTYYYNPMKARNERYSSINPILVIDSETGYYSVNSKYSILEKTCNDKTTLIRLKENSTKEELEILLDNEKKVKLEEKLFNQNGVLIKEKKYLSYLKLSDGSYVEDIYTLWDCEAADITEVHWIIDLKEEDADDDIFDIMKLNQYSQY